VYNDTVTSQVALQTAVCYLFIVTFSASKLKDTDTSVGFMSIAAGDNFEWGKK
jgi:hypothetical protein